MPPKKRKTREDTVATWIFQMIEPATHRFALIQEATAIYAVRDINQIAHDAAHLWARILLNDADATAPNVAKTLIAITYERDEPGAEFWRTDIGQLIFSRGGFPLRPAKRTEAAAVLRVSPEAIRQQIKTGSLRLARKDGNPAALTKDGKPMRRLEYTTLIARESLVNRWKAKAAAVYYAKLQEIQSEKDLDLVPLLDRIGGI